MNEAVFSPDEEPVEETADGNIIRKWFHTDDNGCCVLERFRLTHECFMSTGIGISAARLSGFVSGNGSCEHVK